MVVTPPSSAGLETGVLRPDGMFCPNIGRHRRSCLIAVIIPVDVRTGVDAKVRMDVDNSRCHPLAVRIDDACAGRRRQSFADGLDAAHLRSARPHRRGVRRLPVRTVAP